MKHLALLCEYEGSSFHGWQEQANAHTVQESLRLAWQQISGENCHFQGASRTDAGVSALAHVSDFFTRSPIPTARIPQVLNARLPAGLAVKASVEVEQTFNARFHALAKLYAYNFWCAPSRSALLRSYTTHCPSALDLPAMQDVARKLEGEHDFAAFMDMGSPVRSTVRRLDRIIFLQDESPLLRILFLGNGFLYHQVRILAGTLYYVGLGKLSKKEVYSAWKKKERRLLGKTMPAHGLCLLKVYFPQELFVEDSAEDYKKLLKASAESCAQLFPGLPGQVYWGT